MVTRDLPTTCLLIAAVLSWVPFQGQELQVDQKQRVDEAIPRQASARPQKPRRLLVSNLSMRDGKPFRGSSAGALPVANYAIEQMGKVTGAFEAVFSNDIEMFRPAAITRFDAICFNNTAGVLFEDAELRQSLLAFIENGKGFVGIHDAIATFVQYPVYDQWPEFGRMLGGTENGGHPWNGEVMTMRVEDPDNPINAAFAGKSFEIADQAFQLQEPVLRDHLRVLLRIDPEKSPKTSRRILPVRMKDMDFPMSWIRRHGQGRVFYLGLGHSAPVFWNRALVQHLLAGIQYALGDLEVNDAPDATRGRGAQTPQRN
jgi:type 1 glutamine amidotransferase